MFRLAAKRANITSLCDEGAIHHYGKAITSLKDAKQKTRDFLGFSSFSPFFSLFQKSKFSARKKMSIGFFGQRSRGEPLSHSIQHGAKSIDTNAKI